MRKIKYVEAINEALAQLLDADERVFVAGVGANSPWYMGGSMDGLDKRFGNQRIIDPPVAENSITGMGVGAAMAGMRPIITHPRVDFMNFAMDPIINHAANWFYMTGGAVNVPIVFRGIINRGGEQAAQHSQSLHAVFAHIPGLKVVMPSTPFDAKGLLIASVEDENPVIYMDDRWLYDDEGEVSEKMYSVPIGEAAVRKTGTDITIVASSYMVKESIAAAENLEIEGIHAEVLDLRTISPIDTKTIFHSVSKTGRLVIADGGWLAGGISGEISALVTQELFSTMKAPIQRVALPNTPAPASSALESLYYPKSSNIINTIRQIFGVDYGI